MGQICFKEDMILQPKYDKKQQNQQQHQEDQKTQETKGLKYTTYAEDISIQNMSRDIKITIKQSKIGEHDTEDENYQAGGSDSDESINTQKTISHHRNKDQQIDDISPKHTINHDKLNNSKAKSTASKQTNMSKKSGLGPQYFTGTFGHNSYQDYSQISSNSYDEDELNRQILQRNRRIGSEQQNIKKKPNKTIKSVLSDRS